MKGLGGAARREMVYAGGGIAAAVVAANAAATFGLQQTTSPVQQTFSAVQNGKDAAPTQENSRFIPANPMKEDVPLLSDPEAKVTIVDFPDFQCTNCRRFATKTEPQLAKDCIDEGRASIVFKHFPVFSPNSVTAAMATMCAHEQGMFWEFHYQLYSNKGSAYSGWAGAANLKDFASEVGLDREQFNVCLDSKKYDQYVQADLDLALSLGYSGTPAFIITKGDGSDVEAVVGAQPCTSFQGVINKKLS